jgi:gamma-glutamyltranspeptidase / glutathione hydrolase
MQPKFSVATQDALRALGHLGLGAAGSNGCLATIGSVQGVVMDLRSGRQYGGADLRREGTVIGLRPVKAKGPKDRSGEESDDD